MKNFMIGILSGSIFGFFLAISGIWENFKTAPDETSAFFKKMTE